MRLFIRQLFLLFILFAVANGYGQTYRGTQDGKALRSWYMAGPMHVSGDTPVKPENASQEIFFNRENDQNVHASFATPIAGSVKDLESWNKITWNDDVIDLDSIYRHPDFVSAYAYAIIESSEAKQAILGIGSDDAVKVWFNGKLVHKNWMARSVIQDNDAIPVSLVKGRNELLIEVQDMTGGWAFTARFLSKNDISNKLIRASSVGDLDDMNRMLAAGADINLKGKYGYSALDAARIAGRDDAAKLLLSKGAKESGVPEPSKLVDALYSEVNNKVNPGIAVLIAKDGKIVYEKGNGYADIDNKVKITPQTKFRIGSITKQFVASSILKLQEEGKLSVQDKLSKYFPDFPRGSEVTIHHLLTHTSGIHSFTNKDSFFVEVVKPVTNEQLLNYFKNDPYDFNPGDKYMYNNSGYFLLGLIIEKITGDNYGNYLKKQFFDPIGMTNTGVYSTKIKLTNEALGYEKSGDIYKRALNWNMDWAGGAGSLYSTVEDLYKWNEALFNNKVLKPESMKAAFTPVVLNNGSLPSNLQYGYGWGMSDYRGVASIGHSGGLHGFISQLLRVPKENFTVVLLTNVMPPQVEIDPIRVAELYLWKDMSKQTSFAEAKQETDIEKYAGRYDFTSGMVMTISKEGNGLFAQLSGQPKFQIFPSAPAHYFWKVVPAKIEFVTDSLGKVTHALFEQGSYKINAPRMKDIEAFQADTSLFDAYKGVYKYKENTNITITAMNGKLYVEATNEPRFELVPLSDTEFLLRELNATLMFKKDASGKVNTLTVKLAGDVRDAPRVQ